MWDFEALLEAKSQLGDLQNKIDSLIRKEIGSTSNGPWVGLDGGNEQTIARLQSVGSEPIYGGPNYGGISKDNRQLDIILHLMGHKDKEPIIHKA